MCVCVVVFFQMEQSHFDSGRLSPPRPSTLMLDNGQAMELDNDYHDFDNNQIINYSPPTQLRNKKKKKRAADIPIKKFNGEFEMLPEYQLSKFKKVTRFEINKKVYICITRQVTTARYNTQKGQYSRN